MFNFGPNLKKIEIPSDLKDKVKSDLINKEYYVFVLKFIIAFLSIVCGSVFIWQGIESASTIKFSISNTMNIELNNALPGVILALFGIILMLFSRINIKIK